MNCAPVAVGDSGAAGSICSGGGHTARKFLQHSNVVELLIILKDRDSYFVFYLFALFLVND